jgi:hypothetical protein
MFINVDAYLCELEGAVMLTHRRLAEFRSGQQHPRRGGILVLAAGVLIMVFLFAALVVDFGFLSLSVDQAQTSADAAAHAAAADLYPSPVPQTAIKLPLQLPIYRPYIPKPDVTQAVASAKALAGANRVADALSPQLLSNDIKFGIYDNGISVGPPATLNLVDNLLDALNLRTTDNTFTNSVEVTVRRDTSANGNLKLFFGPLFGRSTRGMQVSSTAAVMRGYGCAADDLMLPFAMDITIWNAIRFTNGEVNAVDLSPLGVDLDVITLNNLVGQNPLLNLVNSTSPYDLMGNPISVLDNYTWRRPMMTVNAGPDKVWEVVLLGDQLQKVKGTGLLGSLITTVKRVPATFVTLDFRGGYPNGPDANYLNRVISTGIDDADVTGTSTTDDKRIWLPYSVPGFFEIPSDCEANLKAIIGQPRIMPLYATLPGTVVNKVTDVLGMRHQFRIVGWGAVVITKVNLSGPIRYINVQPAIYTNETIRAALGIRSSLKDSVLSDGVYTTPHIVK